MVSTSRSRTPRYHSERSVVDHDVPFFASPSPSFFIEPRKRESVSVFDSKSSGDVEGFRGTGEFQAGGGARGVLFYPAEKTEKRV